MQREYYACDALYRNWLKIEQGNSVVPSDELSSDEKERAATAAQQALDAASSLLQSKLSHMVHMACIHFFKVLCFLHISESGKYTASILENSFLVICPGVGSGKGAHDKLEKLRQQKWLKRGKASLGSEQRSTRYPGNHGMWLAGVDDVAEDDLAPDWIELQCTGMLSSSSGSSLVPDASVCTALVDALYNCGAIQGVQRQLTVYAVQTKAFLCGSIMLK